MPITTSSQIEILPLNPKVPEQAGVIDLIRKAFFLSEEEFGYEIKIREVLSQIWLRLFQLCAPILQDKTGSANGTDDKIKRMMVHIHEHYSESENLFHYMQEYTEEFLFIEQACNSPMATDEMIEELEQYNRDTVKIFQRGIEEGILKQTSPVLLISFCYYPIQQIFKEWRKEKSMLPKVDFEMVFQMCWDGIRR